MSWPRLPALARLFCGLWLLLWGGVWGSAAAQGIEVRFDAERIEINLDVVVNAPEPLVSQIVYDYDHLGKVFPLVSRSHLIREMGDGRARVRADLKGCILGICREMLHVMDVVRTDTGWNQGRTVPAQSHVRASEIRWRIDGVNPSQTRLQLSGWVELGRRIPPLIGRPLMRREIRQQLATSAARLEKAAQPLRLLLMENGELSVEH